MFVPFLAVAIGFSPVTVPVPLPALTLAKIWEVKSRPLPTPPPITVAGHRLGFSRNQDDGRISVHFDGFHADHIEVVKAYKPLGTLFFSRMHRQPITDDDLKLLRDP
jgi:hypothetical protein